MRWYILWTKIVISSFFFLRPENAASGDNYAESIWSTGDHHLMVHRKPHEFDSTYDQSFLLSPLSIASIFHLIVWWLCCATLFHHFIHSLLRDVEEWTLPFILAEIAAILAAARHAALQCCFIRWLIRILIQCFTVRKTVATPKLRISRKLLIPIRNKPVNNSRYYSACSNLNFRFENILQATRIHAINAIHVENAKGTLIKMPNETQNKERNI